MDDMSKTTEMRTKLDEYGDAEVLFCKSLINPKNSSDRLR